ncbi:uncharacterized protein SOCE26_014260 [Sorangium cellulosum]|uniref:Uncharacterized protein n=1 Tax=Sorangium cellulosum TaxID=56 RepID=A0A2L0EL49_SORCE|nr:TIM-barrel domain-containing protein [Sorangium cellulosum]AUX40031.1 uncharacterized protein SOCE26_014260 [Sorangium cellulosum]
MRRSLTFRLAVLSFATLAAAACSGDGGAPRGPEIDLSSDDVRVAIALSPFALRVYDAGGALVLATDATTAEGAYGGLAATVDQPTMKPQLLPGWDGYRAGEGPWRGLRAATLREATASSATLEVSGDGALATVHVSVDGARVRLAVEASDPEGASPAESLKTSLSFASGEDERFFGMGERYATVDHRGWSLYSWAEEGALGRGEDAQPAADNPYPSGPSMTYFPVPFLLSSRGYGVHLDTTFRSEVHFNSERPDAWRLAVNAPRFEATLYVQKDPLATLSAYTEDTGRPPVPAHWVFGPRRRVNVGTTVDDVPEWQLLRQKKIPITGIDDAVHFLPANSHVGREETLAAWTETLHAAGYKVMAYNMPYVAESSEDAAPEYAHGLENGFFVKGPDGAPVLTEFISGELLTLATIDLTNPDAFAWFQDLLRRSLDLGYDGWMHDFGEYIPREAIAHDGRRGAELHNAFPVLSAKAAHELLEAERPGDHLFFVRSGYTGTQALVPAVWGGDAEATFDETLGLPSAVRGGLNLSMSGVPYWGSDMTGFKCITDAPNDKEVYLRWVELGAVSPIMMEQNACANPIEKRTKWTLWSDAETTEVYAEHARLHTRLLPYFLVLAQAAHETGRPMTLHPFLMHPDQPEALAVDDAFYLGPALYAAPVVRRGQVEKELWLPPGRFVDLHEMRVHEGDAVVRLPAPLSRLPLLLVSGQILPLLDPSIDTLAPATDPDVVTLDDVADRLDVRVALSPGESASIRLADGTELEARRSLERSDDPGGLVEVEASELPDCTGCFHAEKEGDVDRLRVGGPSGKGAELALQDVELVVRGGPARRVRWDVLRLP